MSDDPEIRRAARFLVRKYGAEADMAVARYAETFLVKGDLECCTFVARVLGAIMGLRRAQRHANEGTC